MSAVEETNDENAAKDSQILDESQSGQTDDENVLNEKEKLQKTVDESELNIGEVDSNDKLQETVKIDESNAREEHSNVKLQETVKNDTKEELLHEKLQETVKKDLKEELLQETVKRDESKLNTQDDHSNEKSNDEKLNDEKLNDEKLNDVKSNDEKLNDDNSGNIKIDTIKDDNLLDDTNKYAEHITYDKDGCAIYTDPETKYQYKWCTKDNEWKPSDKQPLLTNDDEYENEHYRWCNETKKWILKYETETEHFKWDSDKNEWIQKVPIKKDGDDDVVKTSATTTSGIVYDIDKNGQRTYKDKDGVEFFWDSEKNAWFPKIDDDFMAQYQMNYGFIDNTSASEEEQRLKEEKLHKQRDEELKRLTEEAKKAFETQITGEENVLTKKRKIPQEPPKWFDVDPEHNTKVYVANLPLDITIEEFAELMGKCGMIMRDEKTQKPKLKLYTEADGQIKGDGLCDYIKVESVKLALEILDEYIYRGQKIRVQPAKFQMRGEYNPALKPKRKKKDKEKMQKMKEKLFDWRPEKMRGERSKNEKIVIIKNLFDFNIFEKEVQLILDYQNDLREECTKCGIVRKVTIYDRHEEGIAQVNMSSPEEADLVIQMMNGRFFGQRKLTAEHWDGKTKYKIEESEKEVEKRLNDWDKYLESDETTTTTTSTNKPNDAAIESKIETN